jgi:protein-tyrosine phosphatase
MTQITNNLWVGSLDDAYDTSIISNVSHIMNVASELELLPRINHTYIKIAVNDDDMDTNITTILDECIAWITQAHNKDNGTVLVHCLEGKSRSVCVCLAYMCVIEGMTFTDALNLIKTKRPIIDIFPLYQRQLEDYLNLHKCNIH